MVGLRINRTTRWVGCMSVWYHLTTRWWGSPPRGPPGQLAVCQSGTIWPPDGGAVRLEDHQVSWQYVNLLLYHLTTRWWGSALTGPPGELAVCQSDTSWPPDGGAVHLQDHQVSGLFVSLVPSDHQMVGQPTYRTTWWVGCMSVWHKLTTRWWGSPPRWPPGEWAVCQSDTPRLVARQSTWWRAPCCGRRARARTGGSPWSAQRTAPASPGSSGWGCRARRASSHSLQQVNATWFLTAKMSNMKVVFVSLILLFCQWFVFQLI